MPMKLYGGGGGYATKIEDSKEVFHKELDKHLPYDIEHIYPDYSLYPELTTDTAYGFMTRGCPRGCDFCIVGEKEGRKAVTVAPLEEFWHGQKNIVLLDPNPIAAPDWKNNLQQLIDSKSWVDFTQGVDIRLMTEEKAEYIRKIKLKSIHFAWDRYEDKNIIVPKLKLFKEITGIDRRKAVVYVLTNFNTSFEQDLERIYTLRDIGYDPYVMIYQKDKINSKEPVRRLQRWVNNKRIFYTVKRFEEYSRSLG